MYILKVMLNKKIMGVKHYNIFQNALADISDLKFAEVLPSDVVQSLGNPKIYYGSRDNNNIADDFEFRYANGVYVYVGELTTED